MNPAQSHNALVNGTQGRDTRTTEEEKARAAAIQAKLAAEKRHNESTKAGLALAEQQRREKRLKDLRSGWDGYRNVSESEAEEIIKEEGLV